MGHLLANCMGKIEIFAFIALFNLRRDYFFLHSIQEIKPDYHLKNKNSITRDDMRNII